MRVKIVENCKLTKYENRTYKVCALKTLICGYGNTAFKQTNKEQQH